MSTWQNAGKGSVSVLASCTCHRSWRFLPLIFAAFWGTSAAAEFKVTLKFSIGQSSISLLLLAAKRNAHFEVGGSTQQ